MAAMNNYRPPGLPALAFLFIMVALAVAAPVLAPHDPQAVELKAINQAPNVDHWLGTDSMGRDLLSRLLYGSRISLAVGLLSVAIATLLGSMYGVFSAYAGTAVDGIMMRLVDALLSIPSMLLMLVIQSAAGAGVLNLILCISFTSWMQTARMVRGESLAIKERDFIKAAIILGTPSWKIMIRHILPHCLPTIIVIATIGVGHAIISEASISFLGLGVPPHIPSWGNMIMGGQSTILAGCWWISAFPGLAIVSTVLAVSRLGDCLQQRANPRTIFIKTRQAA